MMNLDINYLSLKHASKDDQPREKLIAHGQSTLSNAEILGILIGSGTREKSAVQLSREILQSVDNDLNNLARLNLLDLMKFKGIGEAKAVTIAAALELCRRKENDLPAKNLYIRSSRDAYLHVRERFQDLPHEEFHIVALNRANKVNGVTMISKGGTSGTSVDVKDVFKKALDLNASCIVLCHNHPSGNLQPSKPDIAITKRISSFGELIDLKVHDHLIVTNKSYFSFADAGMLT
jgi:DNA repair protein RadC